MKRKISTALKNTLSYTHSWELQILPCTDWTSLSVLREYPLPSIPDTIQSNKEIKWIGPAWDQKNHPCEEEMTNELWHCHLFGEESKLCVLFSPTLQILHMFYELNFLPPTLNTLICFPIFPHVYFAKQNMNQSWMTELHGSGLVWRQDLCTDTDL